MSSANQAIADLQGAKPQELNTVISERRRVETELSNLVDLWQGAKGLLLAYGPGFGCAKSA